jgi:hypothetical protein
MMPIRLKLFVFNLWALCRFRPERKYAMYGLVMYILFSLTAFLLWAKDGEIILTFAICMIGYSVLLCILVTRQNKKERRKN